MRVTVSSGTDIVCSLYYHRSRIFLCSHLRPDRETVSDELISELLHLTIRRTPILGEKYLFVRPKFYYIILIPCDVVSLALQAAGGAMSSNSSGSDKSGVNISLAGLSFQVITLVAFVAVCASFFIKYARDPNRVPLPAGFTVFASALTLAVVAIFIRCAYRIDELKQGYSGPEIADEGKFIGLEST